MKKIDLAYFAGHFDGEGCICISKESCKSSVHPQYRVHIQVSSVDEWIIRQWHFSFGGLIFKGSPSNLRKHPLWVWKLKGGKTAEILKTLLPYLRLKKAQAEIAIGFCKRLQKGNLHPPLSPTELALREANKILISDLNQRKNVPRG